MIRDKIKADSDSALKDHQPGRVEVLRYLISLIDKKQLQLPPGSMKEEDEIGVLRKELKNKEESKEMFEKAQRTDLIEQINEEIKILMAYLPKEIEETEIKKVVTEVIGEVGGGNFGQIMGLTMKKLAGQASGDTVSRIVKEVIGSV